MVKASSTPETVTQADPSISEHSPSVRMERELLLATRPFATERVAESWWHVGSTFALMIFSLAAAGLFGWWPLRAACSVVGGLAMVRAFIAYHDFMHGSILRESKVASMLFHIYGAFALTPARSWKKSHNYHHGHAGQLSATGVGAFPIISTRMWREASPAQRLRYRATRHPLIVLSGYVTIFAFSICLMPLLRQPKEYWDSAVSLLLHAGLIGLLWVFDGFATAFFVILLPMTVASTLGSYLFFAQHSFKHMYVSSPQAWSFYRAALQSSSYIRLNKVMRWFTGNIGYHHIHHLNVRIPFYRLPQAMASIPELRSPITTSLSPRHIVESFRANLWDEDTQRMVSYREAKKLNPAELATWENEGGSARYENFER